jgi:hypothetical protein
MKNRINTDKLEDQIAPRIIPPFMGPLTYRLTSFLRSKITCKFGYIPGQKLSSMLCSQKERCLSIIGCIYKMICSCKKLYIGETYRDSIIRFNEHRKFIAKNLKNKSAIADHVLREFRTLH